MTYLLSTFKRYFTHKFFHQISWYTLGQFSVQFFSFLGVIITARYLGPINLGLYSFVSNYLSVFLAVTAGTDFYFTWKLAKTETKIQELKKYFGHKLQITIFLSVTGLFLAWSLFPVDVAQMAGIMFLPLVLSSFSGFLYYAIVSQKAKFVARTQIIASVIIFTLRLILIFSQAPLIAFVLINALDLVFVSILVAIFYFQNKDMRFQFSKVAYPSFMETVHFLYTIRATLIVIGLWQILLRIDQLLLALFSNAHTLGIYAVAVKISEVPNVLAGIFATALIPHIATMADKEDPHSRKRIRQVMLAYFFSGLVIACGIIIFAPLIVNLLYGSQFTEAIPVVRVYALSIPGLFVILHYFAVYGAIGRHIFQSIIFACGLILNALLLYFLNLTFGLIGVGLATAITYNSIAISFFLHLKHK